MKVLVGGLLTLPDAGCAGSTTGPLADKPVEPVSVQVSQSPGYDYVVVIQSTATLGFDPHNQEARSRAALAAMKNACDAPQIVGDHVIVENGEARRYELQVKC